MKKYSLLIAVSAAVVLFSGCATVADKMPSEDIEVFEKYSDTIAILRNPDIPPNSKAKYEAAKKLVDNVDLYFTRETRTVDRLFYHGDGQADGINTESPTFTFMYQYADKYIRIRFFTYKMFILRVEIREND